MLGILFIIVLLFVSILAKTTPGRFIRPPYGILNNDFSANPKYTLGETIRLEWEIEDQWARFSLALWQAETNEYEFIESA